MIIVEVTKKDEFVNFYEFPDADSANSFINCLSFIDKDYRAEIV